MRFTKEKRYEYEKHGITEENGYTRWVDLENERNKIIFIGTIFHFFMWVSIYMFTRNANISLKNFGWPYIILFMISVVAATLISGYLLRGTLSLAILSKGKLGSNCFLSVKYANGMYNAEVSRTRVLVSYVLPFILIAALCICAAFLCEGLPKLFFRFQTVLSFYFCDEDIYMFILCLKRTKKGDIIFGEFRKEN